MVRSMGVVLFVGALVAAVVELVVFEVARVLGGELEEDAEDEDDEHVDDQEDDEDDKPFDLAGPVVALASAAMAAGGITFVVLALLLGKLIGRKEVVLFSWCGGTTSENAEFLLLVFILFVFIL